MKPEFIDFFQTEINEAPLILGLQKCYRTFWKALAMGYTYFRSTRKKKHFRMVVRVIQKKVKFCQFFFGKPLTPLIFGLEKCYLSFWKALTMG